MAYEPLALRPLTMPLLLSLSPGIPLIISHLLFDVSYNFPVLRSRLLSLSPLAQAQQCGMDMVMAIGSVISSCMIPVLGKGK